MMHALSPCEGFSILLKIISTYCELQLPLGLVFIWQMFVFLRVEHCFFFDQTRLTIFRTRFNILYNLVQMGSNLSKMDQNCPKWTGLIENGPNLF